jgi:hypothetical protein
MIIHRLSPNELSALRRRQEEIIRFLETLKEIHGLPAAAQISPDLTTFVIPPIVGEDPGKQAGSTDREQTTDAVPAT